MVRLSEHAQITIPALVRKLKGWEPGVELAVVIDGAGIVRIVTPEESSEMLALPRDELDRMRSTTNRGLSRGRP